MTGSKVKSGLLRFNEKIPSRLAPELFAIVLFITFAVTIAPETTLVILKTEELLLLSVLLITFIVVPAVPTELKDPCANKNTPKL